MRNLTIKRTKSFVGCAAKVQIFVADPFSSELVINGIPARKLGELKNGEEKTFSIGTEETKIFAIADAASRNYCGDYYPLPAGEADIQLTGKNHYHPSSGNPFYFDGVTDPEVLENRKKGRKKGNKIIIPSIIAGIIAGLLIPQLIGSAPAKPMEFTANEMTITLTDKFEEADFEGYTQCYETNDVAVFTLQEPFTLIEGFEDFTLEEYGDLVLQSNSSFGPSQLQTTNGVTWFDYTFASGSNDYYYFTTIYKGNEGFWVVQFVCNESKAEEYTPQFHEWAQSVTFN